VRSGFSDHQSLGSVPRWPDTDNYAVLERGAQSTQSSYFNYFQSSGVECNHQGKRKGEPSGARLVEREKG